MKAVLCTKYGPPEVLKIGEFRDPILKDNEVLIRIKSASVTNSDIFIRSADIPLYMQIPMRLMLGIVRPRQKVIGEVLAGEIVKAGKEIKRFKPGDLVYGLTGFSLGAYAEYKCMKEADSKRGCLSLMPGKISCEEATGIAYGGLLALQSIEKMESAVHRRILVYGASGTTGVFALQYLRSLGLDITAVCSGKNRDFVKGFGIGKVLDYTDGQSVKRLEKYDVVFDAVGKAKTSELKEASRNSLTAGGLFLSIDDEALKLDSGRLDRISRLVEEGKIKAVTDRIFPLDKIVEAHKYVETGHKVGNVAIKI